MPRGNLSHSTPIINGKTGVPHCGNSLWDQPDSQKTLETKGNPQPLPPTPTGFYFAPPPPGSLASEHAGNGDSVGVSADSEGGKNTDPDCSEPPHVALTNPPAHGGTHCGRAGICEQCGRNFRRKNPGRFCSPACCYEWRRGRHTPGFVTPDSEREDRIRAQGLVNKRLSLGWFTKPETCVKCGNAHRRITAHHEDYKKPDHVHWVCPGCHLKAHHRPGYLAGIPPFICYDRRTPDQKPQPHGKGGWHGERDADYRWNRSSLTPEQADAVRERHRAGDRQVDIAKAFGISQMTVSRIVRGKRMVARA